MNGNHDRTCAEPAKSSREAMRELLALGLDITAAGELDTVYRLAVERGRACLHVDRMSVWLRVGDSMEVTGTFGIDEQGRLRDERSARVTCSPDSPMGRILLSSGQDVVIEQGALRDERAAPVGTGWQLLVPLWDGQAVIGCVSIDNLLTRGPIDAKDADLVQLFAAVLGHEVTRRRSDAELNRLLHNEQRLHSIIRRSPAIVAQWRITDGYPLAYVSENIDQLGYSAEDLLSGHIDWVGIIHPLDTPRLLHEINDHLARGHTEWTQRYRLRTAAGPYRWFEDNNRVIAGTDAGDACIEGILLDITKRRELEDRLLDICREEQQRIGELLHDSLGQQLTGISFLAEVLHRKLDRTTMAEEAQLATKLVQFTGQAVSHTRQLARGLSPVDVEADGLAEALRDLARNTTDLFGIACRCEIEHPCCMRDRKIASHLYYIVQEAVRNATSHAGASEIVIAYEPGSDARLSIRDNGQGMPADDKHTGLGLRIMAHRAGLIGGSLHVESTPNGGTTIQCAFHAPTAME